MMISHSMPWSVKSASKAGLKVAEDVDCYIQFGSKSVKEL